MGKVKVTEKFQITIPKDVREKINLMPGEIVDVFPIDESTIVVKRIRVKDPLKLLIAGKELKEHIEVEKVEELAEENVY